MSVLFLFCLPVPLYTFLYDFMSMAFLAISSYGLLSLSLFLSFAWEFVCLVYDARRARQSILTDLYDYAGCWKTEKRTAEEERHLEQLERYLRDCRSRGIVRVQNQKVKQAKQDTYLETLWDPAGGGSDWGEVLLWAFLEEKGCGSTHKQTIHPHLLLFI